MEIISTLLARVIHLIDIKTPLYYPRLIGEVADRYQFVRRPSSPEEILAADGPLAFSHGRIVVKGREIFIQGLFLYRTSIVVDVLTTTDDAELVLDDMIAWGGPSLTLDLTTPGRRMFIDQLEVHLDANLGAFSPLRGLPEDLTRTLTRYEGKTAPMFTLSSIAFSIDPTKLVTGCDFRIERRQGSSYEDNVYFSQAPLKTADHVAELQEIERGLRESSAS